MPSYDPAGISIHLGATALAPTITQDPRLRKNEAAKRAEVPDKLLRESKRLAETPIPLPGDKQGFRLGFLKNVPFLQVQAGHTLWAEKEDGEGDDSLRTTQIRTPSTTVQGPHRNGENAVHASSDYRTLRRVTRAHPNASPMLGPPQSRPSPSFSPSLFLPVSTATEMPPKALVLHVLLSEKSFLPSFEDGKPQMLMIDLFFNGMLASSVLMHLRDINSGAKGMHQIFTGHRVDFLIERPWIIFPPKQDDGGGFSGSGKTPTPRQRWNQICTALLQNANDRGFNKRDERPPSADYLQSLAGMEMPDQVQAMQKPGGRCFGVLDVVVTAGNGQKVFSSYLSKPTRMPDPRYKYKNRSAQKNEAEMSDRQNGQRMSSIRSSSDQDVGQADPQLEQHELPALSPSSTWPPFTLPLDNTNLPPLGSDFPSHRGSSLMDFGHPTGSGPPFISSQLPSTFYGSSENEPSGTVNPLNLELIPSNLPSSQVQVSVDAADPSSFGQMAPAYQAMPIDFGTGNTCHLQEDAASVSNSTHGLLSNDHTSFDSDALLPSIPALSKFPYLGPVKHIGPFPPIGRFSVPKSSSSTDPGYIDSSQPRASELISRAVITCKGKIIVDHRWPVAQRVANTSKSTLQNRSHTRRRGASLGSAEYTEMSVSSRRQSKLRRRIRLETPPPTSAGDFGTEKVTESATAAHENNRTRKMLNNQGQLDSTVPNESTKITGNSAELAPLPPRQGPKSNPYIFDDPEKILRSDTKSEQAFAPVSSPALDGKSVSRSAHRTIPQPIVHVKAQTSSIMDPLNPGLSSLMNVSSSPERKLMAQPDSQSVRLKSKFSSATETLSLVTHSTAKSALANPRDSTSRLNLAPAIRPPHTPALALNPIALPQGASSHATSPAATSDSGKKRKKNRVDDIKTLDNPPLNQGCVIAFAQSMEGEAPVLRQVKCEKQGEFTEDMVVCGMRFFIPG